MKNKSYSKLLRLFSLLLVIIILCSSTVACRKEQSKGDILDNISSSEAKRYNYVWKYLENYGVPIFDRAKMIWVEDVFQAYYNVDGGLPDTHTHAVLTASAFMDQYYDNIDTSDKKAVTDALITCYVEAIGDPYSVYRTASEYNDYNNDMSGSFGGIGVVIEYDHNEETLLVSSVYIDSPAEDAGILVGDYIYAVEGKTVEEIGYLNVVNLVRGDIGTQVNITLKRGESLIDVVATRAKVEEKTVAYVMLEDNIGYVQIASFKDNTFAQFVEAIDSLEKMGVKGYIFDLRNNLGGYVHSVRSILSYLLPNGCPIISYTYKNSEAEVLKSETDIHPTKKDPSDPTKPFEEDHKTDLPIVVLCNEYTASAGEIFTAVMRDYNDEGVIDATVIGTNTYGKGVMQSGAEYYDGSSVVFTVAYYNPPCGVNYHGVGIVPDITVDNIYDEEIFIDSQFNRALEEMKYLLNAK